MSEPVDLHGTSILVTGGSMGIGRAAARACLEAGANVTLCARGQDDLQAARDDFARDGYGERVAAVAADVSDAGQVAAAFETAIAKFGTVDGVVHAAAVLDAIGSIVDVDPERWLRVVEIDLFGSFLVTREACARMRESGGGRIVLFSGGGASAAFPNFTAYACSKVAVVRLAESVAQEMASFGIEINALAPGLVATRMLDATLASGAGQPMPAVSAETGARAAAFLVSGAARGITGKFVAAVHDDYAAWPQRLHELQSTDVFTLRRILPKDRGMEWQ